MRVCVLTTSFPLEKGTGPGIHVVEKSRHLVRLGVEVDVLAPHRRGIPRLEVIDGIRVHRFRYVVPEQWQTLCYGAGIPTNLERSLWAKLQLPLLLFSLLVNTMKLARKSDVIHAHWSLAGLVGVMAGSLVGKPVVVMMHHARTDMLQGNPLIRFVVERADYVLCNSHFTLSSVLEISRPKACRVISPGVDVDRFRPVADLSPFYQLETDVPRDVPLIFALGRLIRLKGFAHLIEALALMDQATTPQLMIGGDGPLRQELERYAEEIGVAEQVRFLGYIPNKHTPIYYSAADVFVLPSVVDEKGNTEGLGVVLLESMACETPCIGSRVGGITDIIINGVNGFLVEPADSRGIADRISELIGNDKLRRSMGRQGRLTVEKHFSWQAQAGEIRKVYEELVL